MTFSFRLEPLLRLREMERDARRADLVQAQDALDLLRQRIRAVDTEWDSTFHLMRQSGEGHVDPDRLMGARRYAMQLRMQHDKWSEQVDLLVEEIERRRERLTEADRDVKTLEKLRDRQESAFRQEWNRREQRTLDELALRAYTYRLATDSDEATNPD